VAKIRKYDFLAKIENKFDEPDVTAFTKLPPPPPPEKEKRKKMMY
jgi:hypothetical protein